MRAFASSLLAVFALLPWACSLGTNSSPSAVADQFLQAIQSGDQGLLSKSMTPAALATVQGGEGFNMNGDQMDSFTIGEESITGDAAKVSVQVISDGQPQDLRLMVKRVGGDWRVHGVLVDFGSTEMAFDFESTEGPLQEVGEEMGRQLGDEIAQKMQEAFQEAQTTWEQGGTPQEIAADRARFESIVAVSEVQHERVWQIDVDGRGRTGLEIVRALVEPSGLRVHAGEHADVLNAPCKFVAKQVSRIEAVERLCEELGLYPQWPAAEAQVVDWSGTAPAPDPLRFHAGLRPLPAVFVGPFLVEVSDVIENTPQPTGELQVSVRSLGLASGVLGFQNESREVLRLEKVRDSLGNPLADESVFHMSEPQVRDRYYVYTLSKDLKHLLRPVEAITTIAGQVRMYLPTRVHDVTLEVGETSKKIPGGEITVTSWGVSPRLSLVGFPAENTRVLMSPRRANGDPLGVRFQYSDGWNKKLDAGLDCPSEPAYIDVKICTREEIVHDFVLPPVPLREFAQRPLELEELAFEGPAPLIFEQEGVLEHENGMAQLKVHIHNVSNKDVVTAMVRFEYMDGEGAVLKDFPHTLTGEYDFEIQETGPLARAGETATQETHAAFAPEAAMVVSFELLEAEFADGSRWKL